MAFRYWRCNIVGATRGKLQGKTIAIKDNIPVAGVPMMCGSRTLEDYVPDYDATVVSRILDAGGRISGKAVCEEFCFTATSCTAATGRVVNPHDQTRMALGSSSGSAALVSLVYNRGGSRRGSIEPPGLRFLEIDLYPRFSMLEIFRGRMSPGPPIGCRLRWPPSRIPFSNTPYPPKI